MTEGTDSDIFITYIFSMLDLFMLQLKTKTLQDAETCFEASLVDGCSVATAKTSTQRAQAEAVMSETERAVSKKHMSASMLTL